MRVDDFELEVSRGNVLAAFEPIEAAPEQVSGRVDHAAERMLRDRMKARMRRRDEVPRGYAHGSGLASPRRCDRRRVARDRSAN